MAAPFYCEEDLLPVAENLREGALIPLTMDCSDHLEAVERIGRRHGVTIPVSLPGASPSRPA